eukprot:4869715-Pyramimonas_sp.AAC.1
MRTEPATACVFLTCAPLFFFLFSFCFFPVTPADDDPGWTPDWTLTGPLTGQTPDWTPACTPDCTPACTPACTPDWTTV